MSAEPRVERLGASAYTFPLEEAESDGTLSWDAVTVVVVEAHAGGRYGLGYGYTAADAAQLVEEELRAQVEGTPALAPEVAWQRSLRHLRNFGTRGIGATAVSAVDVALWDLKAKLLDLPLVDLLGAVRDEIAVYGSGGFTSLDPSSLCAQLTDFADQGMMRVKMKVGRAPDEDAARVAAVRASLDDDIELFVDANGAYTEKQALQLAAGFADQGVTWFEEPVSSDNLRGLRFVRERCPVGISVSAGEYGYAPGDFRRMLESRAVDVLQADATRCLGVTGYLKAAALAEAFFIPLSSHCAPALHAHLGCALRQQIHAEWFHDHVVIESMLFDGGPRLVGGTLRPLRDAAGLGLVLKRQDAERFAA